MIVNLGEAVIGKDGKLGELKGFTIDPNSQRADQIVIGHGLLGGQERLAVLGHITGVETGTVMMDLSNQDMEMLELYDPNAYRSIDDGAPGYLPFHEPADQRYNFGMHETPGTITPRGDSDTPRNDTHKMPPTYPAGKEIASDDKRLIVVSEGFPVVDQNGEQVGEVHEFAVETTTGEPTQMRLKRGSLLSSAQVELPPGWVEEFTVRNVVLKIEKGQVEELENNKGV